MLHSWRRDKINVGDRVGSRNEPGRFGERVSLAVERSYHVRIPRLDIVEPVVAERAGPGEAYAAVSGGKSQADPTDADTARSRDPPRDRNIRRGRSEALAGRTGTEDRRYLGSAKSAVVQGNLIDPSQENPMPWRCRS
jgi:hypothetical protein